ncbi:MAG: sulfotransferase [Cyanobacteria bacterium J06627_28]
MRRAKFLPFMVRTNGCADKGGDGGCECGFPYLVAVFEFGVTPELVMLQSMPDFLILGAPKAGTTSLYHYLSQHPQIFMSPNKEPHFFAFEGAMPTFQGPGDEQAWLNMLSVVALEAYQQLFERAKPGQKRGEASTMYLYLEESCDRIHYYLPQVKLIAFLRNPVDRAYSHFKHMRRDGREWEKDFRTALAREPERISQGWAPAWHYTQVGLYHNQLQRYLEKFSSEQVRIYLYDDLLKSPETIYRDLFDFIGVDADWTVDTSKRYNTTSVARKNKVLHDFLMKPNALKTALRQIIPAHIRKPLSAKMYRKNATAIQPLSMTHRLELIQRFEPEILRLQELLGRDLSDWIKTEDRCENTGKPNSMARAEMGKLEENDSVKAA